MTGVLCRAVYEGRAGPTSLPYFHTEHMMIHMKTTLVIDDRVMRRLKAEAARRGQTISELVEASLRMMLSATRERPKLPRLPSWDGGGARVDVADRTALYRAMEKG